MAVESPWPIDPTPGDMAYVGVCPTCHGMTFVYGDSGANRLPDETKMLIKGLRECITRGQTVHRVPCDMIRNSHWFFCHCHRKAVPHGR